MNPAIGLGFYFGRADGRSRVFDGLRRRCRSPWSRRRKAGCNDAGYALLTAENIDRGLDMMPIAGFASTGVRVARMLVLCGLICVPAAHFAAAAARSEPAYEDNRSDAVSLIRSLYNALNRKEYLRAYSYWAEGATGQTFDAFEKGYRDTVRIRLKTGPVISEGAAGSAYYTVPAAIRTIDKSGRTVVFAGCYTLRLADPKIQANPPFQPMHIESGKLRRAKGHLSTSVPTSCDTQ